MSGNAHFCEHRCDTSSLVDEGRIVQTATMRCRFCLNDFEMPAERCPHCAEPGIFPNVEATQEQKGMNELDLHWRAALADAATRGCDAIVQEFAAACTGSSKAVISRWIDEIERLARTDKQIYASYYQQRRAQLRQPDGDKWDALREAADQGLFGEHKEHLRFAALSLDGLGVLNYGDWSMILRTSMIERRASTFVENTAVFVDRKGIPASRVAEQARGYRSSWGDRAKLCVAKLAPAVTPATTAVDFPDLLLEQGPRGKSEDDRFVEVHVWGPLTIRTVEKVVVRSRDTRRTASKARLRALEESLQKVGARFEVRP